MTPCTSVGKRPSAIDYEGHKMTREENLARLDRTPDVQDQDGIVEIKDDEVNVVEIMRQIRENIRRRGPVDLGPGFLPDPGDGPLDADFRYNLEEAAVWHDKIYVDDQARGPRTPIDVILSRIRRPAHELVRFYINRMCDKQVAVNSHLIRAIGAVGSEGQRHSALAEEVRQLREEVQSLRQQVEELRCLRKG